MTVVAWLRAQALDLGVWVVWAGFCFVIWPLPLWRFWSAQLLALLLVVVVRRAREGKP
jgi:hypothetical protein